eukprot:jgi/Botrbrau1/11545/Bobra.0393s0023.1
MRAVSRALPYWRNSWFGSVEPGRVSLLPDPVKRLNSTSTNDTVLGYCINKVRTYDYENYLWIINLAKELRPPLFVLRAFNVETALVLEVAKEAQIAAIRLEWWKTAVDSVFTSQPEQHPVIEGLAQVLGRQQSTKYRLQRIVSSRQKDSQRGGPPPDMKALEQYADGTASQLLHLQMELAGIRDAQVDHAVSHLGKAIGISTLLRGTQHHALRRKLYIPITVLAQERVSQEDIFRGISTPNFQDAVHKIASVAKAHLDEARALREKLPRQALPLMLPAVGCSLYLDALEKADFDALSLQAGAASPLWYLLSLKYHLLRGTY